MVRWFLKSIVFFRLWAIAQQIKRWFDLTPESFHLNIWEKMKKEGKQTNQKKCGSVRDCGVSMHAKRSAPLSVSLSVSLFQCICVRIFLPSSLPALQLTDRMFIRLSIFISLCSLLASFSSFSPFLFSFSLPRTHQPNPSPLRTYHWSCMAVSELEMFFDCALFFQKNVQLFLSQLHLFPTAQYRFLYFLHLRGSYVMPPVICSDVPSFFLCTWFGCQYTWKVRCRLHLTHAPTETNTCIINQWWITTLVLSYRFLVGKI